MIIFGLWWVAWIIDMQRVRRVGIMAGSRPILTGQQEETK